MGSFLLFFERGKKQMEIMKKFDKAGLLMGLKGMIGGGMKANPMMSLMENPEDYKLEAYIEGNEIVMRIRKKNSVRARKQMVKTVKRLP